MLYRQQLTELPTQYGDIFEVWFDGSLVVPVKDILEQYAPEAMVFQSPQAAIRTAISGCLWSAMQEFVPTGC